MDSDTRALITKLNVATSACASRIRDQLRQATGTGGLTSDIRSAIETELWNLDQMGTNPSDPVPTTTTSATTSTTGHTAGVPA